MEEKKEIGCINNFNYRNHSLNLFQYVLLKQKLKKKEEEGRRKKSFLNKEENDCRQAGQFSWRRIKEEEKNLVQKGS